LIIPPAWGFRFGLSLSPAPYPQYDERFRDRRKILDQGEGQQNDDHRQVEADKAPTIPTNAAAISRPARYRAPDAPLPCPPSAGLHDISPLVSTLRVTSALRALSAHSSALAASRPAWPPPTLMTAQV
jgi:hypothetical protein